MVNQAIAAADTEASGGLMGSLLGSLNDAPVDNSQIGGIASNLQSVLQAKGKGDPGALMGTLQTVAATGPWSGCWPRNRLARSPSEPGLTPPWSRA